MKKVIIAAAALTVLMPLSASTGWAAADESTMMSMCNTYAAKKLHVSTMDIADVKYEGQRTDGTHAVNGTTTSGQTFQCTFNKAGTKVKKWFAGPAPKGSAPASSAGTPSKDEQACLAATSRETNNGDVMVLCADTSEANNTVYVGVGEKRAKWRCLVKNGKVAEVESMGN